MFFGYFYYPKLSKIAILTISILKIYCGLKHKLVRSNSDKGSQKYTV